MTLLTEQRDAWEARRVWPLSFSIQLARDELGRRRADVNSPETGKRPLSSMAPTIVDGGPDGNLIAIGGSGGSRIFGAVAQVR